MLHLICFMHRVSNSYQDGPLFMYGDTEFLTLIRMDHGIENGLVGTTQIGFRACGTDSLAGPNSIRYGTSPANVVS